MLFKRSANVNQTKERGECRCTLPPRRATHRWRIHSLITRHRADLNAPTGDNRRDTALIKTANNSQTSIADLLLAYFADVSCVTRDGDSALTLAVSSGNTDIALSLLAAAKGGHIGVPERLVERGAKLDLNNVKDLTALQVAVRANQAEMVEPLSMV